MKKNTSRKVLSMALAMVMSLTLCVPAFAVNFTENNSTKTLIENSLIKTEYEDIYKCTSGKYVMKADENTYLVMEKEDIPFSSEKRVSEILTDEAIPKEIRKSISKYYNSCTSLQKDEIALSLFRSVGICSVGSPVSPGTFEASYTLNGREMQSYVLKYTHVRMNETAIYQGAPTANVARSMFRFTLECFCAGNPIGSIASSIFGIGTSALQCWKAAHPSVHNVGGCTDDIMTAQFYYDLYQKWVYVYSDAMQCWNNGLYAEKVAIKNLTVDQYYYIEELRQGFNKAVYAGGTVVTFTAPDYTNPWQAAYDNMFLCKYEPVEVTAGNARFVFNSI